MLKKRVIVKIVFLFTTLAYFMPIAQANVEDENAFALAKQSACLGCHAVNKKVVGPSFQAVAEKYKNDSNAQVFLKNKIAKGGSGSWGVVPMPANSKLSDADLSTLTSWILRGAPNKN
ncbi:c-type cytochrome [Polynucleobacter sp. JS-JIR-II-50]|uniref:c-type cytochrome n=1 Tax=Polynucleobacter sp. JS-JIR-II-50 TaxID=2576919 RepID=UPI001BFD27A2|nr:c-type cytochrome [Polynucleobacter sp. JS-JIR-II-50]QWE04523.1 c-type cytochrome [Polynucleobacter sp. JS-JIR-II-50]